jgi:hypothetical protein
MLKQFPDRAKEIIGVRTASEIGIFFNAVIDAQNHFFHTQLVRVFDLTSATADKTTFNFSGIQADHG